MIPAALYDKMERVIANDHTLAAEGIIAQLTPDDCRIYTFWGFSCFSTQNGTLVIRYSIDNATYRVFETIPILANVPDDRIYRVTKRWYYVTYTDISVEESDVDLSTVKQNN